MIEKQEQSQKNEQRYICGVRRKGKERGKKKEDVLQANKFTSDQYIKMRPMRRPMIVSQTRG